MGEWHDEQPIYLQLYDMVLHQIMTGALPEGEAIPSVRQVASQERINPLTVSKAYQLLADEDLVEKRRGVGMFVRQGARSVALAREREQFVHQDWPRVVARIRALGIDLRQLVEQEEPS